MASYKSIKKLTKSTGKKTINRRTFLSKSIGCTAGLSLLAFPEIITEVLAANEDKSKEEIFKELDEKVDKLLPMYRSCALTSFAALNQQFQLKAEDTTLRALMPFTGGIAGRGETCGAVSGALLALGLFFEPNNQNEMEKAGSSYKPGGVFFDRFAKEFDSTRCKEVVKHQYGRYYDFQNPEDQKLFIAAAQKNGKCSEVMKKAAHIAADIILEHS